MSFPFDKVTGNIFHWIPVVVKTAGQIMSGKIILIEKWAAERSETYS